MSFTMSGALVMLKPDPARPTSTFQRMLPVWASKEINRPSTVPR